MSEDPVTSSRRTTGLMDGRLAHGRLGRLVGAYLAACLAVALVLPIGLLLGDLIAGRPLTMHASDWLVLPAGLFVVSVIAAAPFATFAIVLAESFRIAALPPYLVAGGLIGMAAEALVLHLPIGRPEAPPASLSLYLLIASVGALAGLVYWLIAVRPRRILDPR